MNDLTNIQNRIATISPEASTALDLSETKLGSSWLDIRTKNHSLSIEHRPSLGYGLHLQPNDSFGSGPSEIYRDIKSLLKRISMLLNEERLEIKLKEIRELLGKTQEDLLALSGKRQPAISKLESRADMRLSSLINFIKALGGSLEIKVHFEEFDVPVDLSELECKELTTHSK